MSQIRKGHLSGYFLGIAAKTLSAVEARLETSRQHEFNGVSALKELFGAKRRDKIPTQFLYFSDGDDEGIADEGYLTWYDARVGQVTNKGRSRSEYRLYFPTTRVSQCMAEGDLLFIAQRQNDAGALVVVAEGGSTIAYQLRWLFGLDDLAHPGFSIRSELDNEQDRIGFAASLILETIGIVVTDGDDNFLDDMLTKFRGRFPSPADFSEYARSTLPDIEPKEGASAALMAWVEREEILFRTLEKHVLAEQLSNRFGRTKATDSGRFLTLSRSVQNRRRLRADTALESHLEAIFHCNKIAFERNVTTEPATRIEFLFPSEIAYRDRTFPSSNLTALTSKALLRDRWREAASCPARVTNKYLVTLEPALSEQATEQLFGAHIQLVLPSGLLGNYRKHQQARILSVEQLLYLLVERQQS